MATVNDTADYIISKLNDGRTSLNVLKLQKLMYYCQAWSLALRKEGRLFNGDFQAWVHGPVNRELYDRLSGLGMYSPVNAAHITPGFTGEHITPDEVALIEAVLEEYAHLTGDQLEEMTHNEAPWLQTRGDIPPQQRCERVIEDEVMAKYYRARLQIVN